MSTRALTLIIAVPLALAALILGGAWAYINVIKEDPPERLTLDDDQPPSSNVTATTSGVTATTGIDGTWQIAAGSQAGYRVKETLFGQSSEAAGRTDDVTGQFLIAGTEVTSGSFAVDMTTVASDQSRRDGQFRGRIMNVSQFPTSTFTLARAVNFGSVPDDGATVSADATGNLMLRGTTKNVTIPLTAKRSGERIEVAGNIEIVFADWGIPNPSGGPAQTADEGELEFLLVFTRA